MLEPLDNNLWHARHAFSANGVATSTRMTVVRLPGGALWLHSPIPVNTALRAELDALGRVAFIVAPSKTHHLFAGACAALFPDATLYGAPGLNAKRPDLVRLIELADVAGPPWAPELDHFVFGGIPFANEAVWFHRPSATLIVTDLVQWWQGELPWPARLYARLTGVRQRLAVAHTVRALVRDRGDARVSAERVLQWPVERVVMAHNSLIDVDAHGALTQALATLR